MKQGEFSNVVFKTPLTTMELSENKLPYRVSLIDNFTAYSSYSQALSSTTVAVALTVIRSSLYQNSDLTSETLTIDFRNLPCPPSGCEYVVEIPNRDQLDLFSRQHRSTRAWCQVAELHTVLPEGFLYQ